MPVDSPLTPALLVDPVPLPGSRAEQVVHRHRQMQAQKAIWLPMYQIIGQYVFTRKQNFTIEMITEGQFLVGKIFDSTAPMANHQAAASMIGALWPNGAKTFQIEMPDSMSKDDADSQEVRDYFKEVTSRVARVFDNPRSGFLIALDEYMHDQTAFGISGMAVFENDDPSIPVQFVAVDCKKITIDEGPDGFVDTVYILERMTVKQIVQKYVHDKATGNMNWGNVSEKIKSEFNATQMDTKHNVLHAIEPRQDGIIPNSPTNMNFKIRSIHVDIDSSDFVMKESGYHEMPVFVTRFWKTMGEKYGRSPAMEAMPDIIEINMIRESSIVAIEKTLDPPLVVLQDGQLGGGKIDTSAGKITVMNVSGRLGNMGMKPIEPLITVGPMESTYERIKELTTAIEQRFFVDRMTDLNNETRMTLGEANIRNQLRGQSLGTIYSRQIAELFEPMIQRVFNILLLKGMLGVPENSPQAMREQQMGRKPFIMPTAVFNAATQGDDMYKIRFISPAAKIMRSEELMGISQVLQILEPMAGVVPDILDNFDIDELAYKLVDLTGAPHDVLRGSDVVKQIRQAKFQAQQAQQQLAVAHTQAQTAKAGGQAAQAAAKAGLPVNEIIPAIMGGQAT